MKKRVFIALLLVLLTLLSACADDETPATDTTYRITVKGDTGLLDGALPEKAEAGDVIEVRTHVLLDMDIIVTVNGTRIEKSHSASNYWGYTFTMPAGDVEINLEAFDGFNVWHRLSFFLPWLDTLAAESVKTIEFVNTNSGVSPGTLKRHAYTNDPAAIARLVKGYQTTTLQKYDDLLPPGSPITTVRFTLNSGTVYTLTLWNGGVFEKDRDYFTMIDIPVSLAESEITGKAFSFVTYEDRYEVYACEGDHTPIGHIQNLSSLTFTVSEESTSDYAPEYRITTDFGELFIINETLFYVTSRGTTTYYTLTEGSFDAFFSFPE